MTLPLTLALTSLDDAALGRDAFEEPSGARLALGLGGGGTGDSSVLASRTLGVGDASVGAATGGRGFKKSGHACRAHVLTGDGPAAHCMLARWTLDVSGGTRVGLRAASRRVGFEESGRAHLALGLSGGSADSLGILSRGTPGVRGAPLQRKIY